ncbi:MAG: ATP-binding protein [Bryobacteraceae bacterium]
MSQTLTSSDQAVTTELRLPSRLGFEKVAMSTAATVAEIMGFSENRIEDLKTAVAEACINAIEHGNRLDASQTVLVVLAIGDNTLEVKILDHGSGAGKKPVRAPDIDRKMHGEEELRGMGMFLIQSLVDEAEWVSDKRGGSYARLAIHLDREKGEADDTAASN